jgi:hypothetical protein
MAKQIGADFIRRFGVELLLTGSRVYPRMTGRFRGFSRTLED